MHTLVCLYDSSLSQHCEIKVRLWSERHVDVQDAFLDFNVVGHETAAIQLENIEKSLQIDGFIVGKVLKLSSDSLTVM